MTTYSYHDRPSSSALSRSYVFGPGVSSVGHLGGPLAQTSTRAIWGGAVPVGNLGADICQAPAWETADSKGQADGNPNLTSRLVEYLTLGDDWDGYEGKAASLETVMDAFNFLQHFPSTLPQPKPMIAGSGVIGLYWEGNGCYASIDFDGSEHYCYIADRADDEWGEDQVPVSAALPQRLIEVIAETTDRL